MFTRRTLIALLAFCACGWYQMPARAEATSERQQVQASVEVQQAIQAAYGRRNAAASGRDVNGALAYYAGDFLFIGPEGETADKKASRRLLSHLFATAGPLRITTAIQHFALTENEAVILTSQTVQETYPSGRAVEITRDACEDTWIKGAQGWQLKRCKILSRTQTVTKISPGYAGPEIGDLSSLPGIIRR